MKSVTRRTVRRELRGRTGSRDLGRWGTSPPGTRSSDPRIPRSSFSMWPLVSRPASVAPCPWWCTSAATPTSHRESAAAWSGCSSRCRWSARLSGYGRRDFDIGQRVRPAQTERRPTRMSVGHHLIHGHVVGPEPVVGAPPNPTRVAAVSLSWTST